MIKILFVDDEPSILQGIKRVTRSMRDEWKMDFFEGGEAALEHMRANPVDVIVSDMRMPGMDGAELLRQVRDLSPGTARIILSGYAEEEAVFRSTRVAHQFLSKPCDVRELRTTIERIDASRGAVQPGVIRDLVGSIGELPALGVVYAELMQAIQSDTSSSESLGAIVSKDVALTAQLLRLINSTFFGLSTEVTSVAHAISFLGFDVVKAIVIGHSLFDGESNPIIDIDEVGRRARLAASLARSAVKMDGGKATTAAEAYLAGMLHEIGLLVLSKLPEDDTELLRSVLRSNDLTNERLAFDVDRFVVGAHLLGLWGFSPTIVSAVSALSDTVDDLDDEIAIAIRLAHQVLNSPLDLRGELTDDQLVSLLRAAENNSLLELDDEVLAA